MTEKKYPEDIYPKRKKEKTAFGIIESWHSTSLDYERAYDLGFRDGRFKERLEASNPLAGWSNLTEAIKAGERIDWEKLDGLEAKCVHPELGALTYKLEHDEIGFRDNPGGWYTDTSTGAWKQAFYDSWMGFQGWTLYIKGDIPLCKLTADQLEPGTCFSGSHPEVCEGESVLCVVIGQANGVPGRVLYPGPTISRLASEVEVVEVYRVGTFEKPEGDA